MKAEDARKLHLGDEVIEKSTGKSIRVIDVFEDKVGDNFDIPVVMIEGTRSNGHYDHWSSDQVK